jgi:hypothetical protein
VGLSSVFSQQWKVSICSNIKGTISKFTGAKSISPFFGGVVEIDHTILLLFCISLELMMLNFHGKTERFLSFFGVGEF